MARAKVVESDYYQFMQTLQRAGDAGRRIDRVDAGRWSEFVKRKSINEVAATAIAKQKFESAVPVIIDEGLDTDGLYFYSRDEEACLRLIALED
jgi:hypothetical protein